jgi:hypothetical protein
MGERLVIGLVLELAGIDAQLAKRKLGKKIHPDHGGCQRPTAAMVTPPRRRVIRQSPNSMISDKSMSLKLEVGPGQKIRDGSGMDPGRIRDGSTIRIRHGVVFLFPAIREQYVRTIYSGSVRRHYLHTYYVLSYTTHWVWCRPGWTKNS